MAKPVRTPVVRSNVRAIVATGPFLTSRPTSVDVIGRWRWLTGRQGHPADPEFSRYLSMTLSTLVLDGALLSMFERFLSRFALLLAGDARAQVLLANAVRSSTCALAVVESRL